jgi:hypothetical protein
MNVLYTNIVQKYNIFFLQVLIPETASRQKLSQYRRRRDFP